MNKQANEIEDIYGFFSSGSISINKERRGTLRAFHPQDQTNPLIPVLEGIFVKSRTFRAHNTKNFMVYVCPLRQRGGEITTVVKKQLGIMERRHTQSLF